jgi:allophanate hydrolase
MVATHLVYQLVFRPMVVAGDHAVRYESNDAHGPIWISYDDHAHPIGTRGPLAGKRLAVKDNIDVAGFDTTAACPDFSYRPERSARVIENLEGAGMQVVGKTNLDQFACGLVGTRSPYGPVPNSFDPRYVSGGSSSGSAIAVARGLVEASLGTDTAGSGRIPAGFNNIVGLKPTRGLISTRGVIPACRHIDCVSIFAPTVADAVDVLIAAAGPDAEDPHSRAVSLDLRPMPSSFRYGIPDGAHLEFFGDGLYEAAYYEALDKLIALGGMQSSVDFAPMAEVASSLYEGAWVAERYTAIRSFYDAHAAVMDPVVRTIIGQGTRYSAADLFEAIDAVALARKQAALLWDSFDVLVVPTAPTIYTIDQLIADPIALNRNLGTYTNFVNLLDMTAIAVPSSIRADGLPFGITLIGPAGSDLRLADLAQRFHHASDLTVGATGRLLPPPRALARPTGANQVASVRIAVVGAHLSGLALNGQLLERGARLEATVNTAPHYRFFALPGTTPPKPGLLRVERDGVPIEAEIWSMPVEHYGSFVAMIPSPLGIGSIELADGSRVQGFLCESTAVAGAEDISHFGGWRAYRASQGRL